MLLLMILKQNYLLKQKATKGNKTMSTETINFAIENENTRHRNRVDELKRQIEDLKHRIDDENKHHQQQMQNLKQQKINALEDEKIKNARNTNENYAKPLLKD